MEQSDFLFRVVEALEQAHIPYAVTGSWASITYGMPRTTHDIDLIVSIQAENVSALVASFPPPIYSDAEWISEAATLGEFFNIIDP
jgi:aminoglycoside-2''-adenylyltransferase